MTLQKDAQSNEKKYLRQFAGFENKRVLEIGCGEGRLTWQYAKTPHSTIAFDSDHDALRVAQADKPHDLQNKVHLACAQSEHIPFSKETFDIAILAWSF